MTDVRQTAQKMAESATDRIAKRERLSDFAKRESLVRSSRIADIALLSEGRDVGYYKRLMIEAMQPKEEPPMEVLLPKGYKMTITPQPWIPVSERLPEEDRLVLWYRPDERWPVSAGRFCKPRHVDEGGDLAVPFSEGLYTHWMPLPALPTE